MPLPFWYTRYLQPLLAPVTCTIDLVTYPHASPILPPHPPLAPSSPEYILVPHSPCSYWSVTTLSMVEANSSPSTLVTTFSSTARASLFLLFNITLGSYILGTITLLVVKQVGSETIVRGGGGRSEGGGGGQRVVSSSYSSSSD